VKQLDFHGLVDAAGDVIGVSDREQVYVYANANAALERATGVPGAMLLGKRNDDRAAKQLEMLRRQRA
jgi:PAS domain-containing protein